MATAWGQRPPPPLCQSPHRVPLTSWNPQLPVRPLQVDQSAPPSTWDHHPAGAPFRSTAAAQLTGLQGLDYGDVVHAMMAMFGATAGVPSWAIARGSWAGTIPGHLWTAVAEEELVVTLYTPTGRPFQVAARSATPSGQFSPSPLRPSTGAEPPSKQAHIVPPPVSTTSATKPSAPPSDLWPNINIPLGLLLPHLSQHAPPGPRASHRSPSPIRRRVPRSLTPPPTEHPRRPRSSSPDRRRATTHGRPDRRSPRRPSSLRSGQPH